VKESWMAGDRGKPQDDSKVTMMEQPGRWVIGAI
jgi:hypothetical protein